MKFWAVTLNDAEDFFNLCLEREAITEKERLAILDEMMAERSHIKSGEFENEMIEKQLNQKRIIGIRYSDSGDDSVDCGGC